MARLKAKWVPSRILKSRPRPDVVEPAEPPKGRLFRVLRTLIGLWFTLRWMMLRGQDNPIELGYQVRYRLEKLGGLWIKVGLLIGSRTDLFGPEFCAIVGQVRGQTTGFPFRFAKEALEEDLDRPVDVMFTEFDEEPFSAGEIGQLHRAVLARDGAEVAVKVRRPYVKQIIEDDIRIIGIVVLLCRILRVMPEFRWQDFKGEIDRTVIEELDYRYEAAAIRRMRRNFKKHKRIYAPYVYRKLATERVLVMEFTRGVLMADVLRLQRTDPQRAAKWFEENDIKPRALARRLYHSMMRQRFVDNLFHSELAPNNIVLLKGGRACIIDFSSISRLDDEARVRFADLQGALAEGSFAKVVDLFLLLPPNLPRMDIELVRVEMLRAVRAWHMRSRTKNMSFADRSAVNLFAELAHIARRYDIPLPWSILRLIRATLILDVTLRALSPRMDHYKAALKYARAREKEQNRQTLKALRGSFDVAELIHGLSDSLHRTREEGAYKLEYMRRRARVFQAIPTKLAFGLLVLLNLIGLAVDVGAVYTLGLYSYQYHDGFLLPPGTEPLFSSVPMVSEPGWVLIGVTVAILFAQMVRIRARFRQPDVELPGRRS